MVGARQKPMALWAGLITAALIILVFCFRHYIQDGGNFSDHMLPISAWQEPTCRSKRPACRLLDAGRRRDCDAHRQLAVRHLTWQAEEDRARGGAPDLFTPVGMLALRMMAPRTGCLVDANRPPPTFANGGRSEVATFIPQPRPAAVFRCLRSAPAPAPARRCSPSWARGRRTGHSPPAAPGW